METRDVMEIKRKTDIIFAKVMKTCLAIVIIMVISIIYMKVSTRIEVSRFFKVCENEFNVTNIETVAGTHLDISVQGEEEEIKDFMDKTKSIYSTLKTEKLYTLTWSRFDIIMKDAKGNWVCSCRITSDDLKNTDWQSVKTYADFMEKADVRINDNYQGYKDKE